MKQEILIGTTDYTVLVKIRDDAGAPATGLTEASIDIAYARVETDNDVTTTDVTPAALSALTDAHTDWGFEEVSATDHPGLYRLDIADAVFASGAWSAVVTITGTGLDPCDMEFILVAFNPRDGVRLGLTALPNAAADAAGGLPISDAGGLDLDAKVGALTFGTANRVNAQVYGMEAGTVTAAAIANGAIDAATFAADVDAEILSYLVDDATRIDASALNTASGAIGSNGSGLTEAGGTGDHLTAVPWNASWDAEVQSEVDDAIVANNLDHLCKTATGSADMTTEVADNTILSRILSNGDTSVFDPSTDGLQPARDNVGAAGAGLTEAGGTGDQLTAVPWNSAWDAEVESEVDDALGGGTGTALTGIPWNAAWDAEVQSECTDALNAYDPPTKAETDALLTTALTESYAADGSAPTLAQAVQMILQRLIDFSISGTTITVRKRDGSTTAFTLTLDDGTDPTDVTQS